MVKGKSKYLFSSKADSEKSESSTLQPLKVLFALGGTTHNFINETLADKLGKNDFDCNESVDDEDEDEDNKRRESVEFY
uniref:Uncharacterized protein n=1 Tax=Solanum lycopersicum TaxID=4081 RepID=A0A3Q7FNY5_SOLLC